MLGRGGGLVLVARVRALLCLLILTLAVTSIALPARASQPPVASQQPTISGNPQVGETLTVDPGVWSPAWVSFDFQWYAAGVEISGATQSSHLVTVAQLSQPITVAVTGVAVGHSSVTEISAPTEAVAPGVIVPATPSIDGVVTMLGGTLTAEPGDWQPSGVDLGYQWLRNDDPITGATDASYTVGQLPWGETFSVEVTGSLPGYTPQTETSAAVGLGLAPISGEAPSISGEARVGETLTAEPGSWTPAAAALTYRWFATDESGTREIPDATGDTLILTAGEVAATITVQVTGTAPGYTDLTLESEATAPVVKGVLTAPIPEITGRARLDETLTVVTPEWSPAGVTLSYQWYATASLAEAPSPIAGATGVTLHVPYAASGSQSLLGKRVTVRVTGALNGYEDSTMVSDPTEPIREFVDAGQVTLEGTAKVGTTLTVDLDRPHWDPQNLDFTYWWRIGSKEVYPSADQDHYTPTPDDVGEQVRVSVTGYVRTNRTRFGNAEFAYAGPVVPGDLEPRQPTLSGSFLVGQTITADPGEWGPLIPADDSDSPEERVDVNYGYQWNVDGEPITGAQQDSLVLTEELQGRQISVTVTGSADGYHAATRISASHPVAPAPADPIVARTPTITGEVRTGALLTLHRGVWTPSGLRFSQQWLADGAPIPGAIGTTFRVGNAQAGKRIAVRVRGRVEAQDVTLTSAPTAASIGVLSPGRARVKGKKRIGKKLTVKPGAWGPRPVTFHYQWLRNGKKIKGAHARRYRLVRRDRGKQIRVRLLVTRPSFQKVTVVLRAGKVRR